MPPSSIDHVTAIVTDLDSAVAQYAVLLGGEPVWRGRDDELGTVSALFGLGNTILELVAPGADDERTAGLRAWIAQSGQGLHGLAFGAEDLDALRTALREQGLRVTPPEEGLATGDDGSTRKYRAMELSPAATGGLPVRLVERPDFDTLRRVPRAAADAVEALDHVVLRSARPDAAVELYRDRLGLRLALDREQFGARMLFFRVGGVTLEVIGHERQDEPDGLWGLAYRVRDIDSAHARLQRSGLSLSPIRDGRKPGTRTFTVQGGAGGVPTLVIRDPARD